MAWVSFNSTILLLDPESAHIRYDFNGIYVAAETTNFFDRGEQRSELVMNSPSTI